MENNQQNNENIKVYTAGEVGSLLESINDGIKVISEDQSSIRKDIDMMKSDISGIKEKLEVMDVKLSGKAEQKTVENHEHRISKLEKAIAV
jgi:cell division septum initiation protein DivIVA